MRIETISVTCGFCGKRTPKNIPIHQGVQVYTHVRGTRLCRIVVIPDPAGRDHRSEPIPNESRPYPFLEQLLRTAPDVLQRHRALLRQAAEAVA